MNKKGFTLVEIIVCVALIAIVAIIVGVNSDKIFGNNNKSADEIRTTIESAAEIYAEGNGNVIAPLYGEKGFIILTVGDLIGSGYLEEGITDENGDVISETTEVLVTLNSDGYLEFTYNPGSTAQGYLVAPSITIAKADTFECSYLINDTNGLKFSNNNGDYLDASGNPIYTMSEVTSAEDVDENSEYYCNKDAVTNGTEGKYAVTYTYQLEGVKKTTTREVNVLGDFKTTIEELDNNDYVFYKTGNDYILYTNHDTFTFDITSNYGTSVQFIYKLNNGTAYTNPSTILENTTGNYNLKIYVAKKIKTYSDTELVNLSSDKLIEVADFSINATKLGTPNITAVNYKKSDDSNIAGNTWTDGKKITLTTDVPEKVGVTYEYSFDNSTWTTFTNGDLFTQPQKIIYLRVTNKFGQQSSANSYNYYVDTIPATPTATGTSSTYATSRTLTVTNPTTTYDTSTKYYYYLSNTAPTASTEGIEFTGTSLTLTVNDISSGDTAKYVYFKAKNNIGSSNWSSAYNIYLSKNISNLINNNKGCTSVSGKGCFYKGEQSGNYVSFGGKTWRIFQKDSSNQLHLILEGIYDNTTYAFSNYELKGYCSNTSCCNGGSGVDSYDSYDNPYMINAISKKLSSVYTNFTSTEKNLIQEYTYQNEYNSSNFGNNLLSFYAHTKYAFSTNTGSNVGTSKYQQQKYLNEYYNRDVVGLTNGSYTKSYNQYVGLLKGSELDIIAKCSGTTCEKSYLDSVTNKNWGVARTYDLEAKTTNMSTGGYYHNEAYFIIKTHYYNSEKTINIASGSYYIYDDYNNDNSYNLTTSNAGTQLYIRPVIVIKSTAKIVGGSGTSTDAYILG